jgi:hypothetical protein
MEFQKLRPIQSQWHYPCLSAEEGRARAAQRPVVPAPKAPPPPPKGKGGELWQKFYTDAVARAHPDPEKLADAMLRSRERSLELAAERHKVLVTAEKPKSQETVVSSVKKTGRAVVHDAFRCKALTLEGRRCGFKAVCGDFCKKHATAEKI